MIDDRRHCQTSAPVGCCGLRLCRCGCHLLLLRRSAGRVLCARSRREQDRRLQVADLSTADCAGMDAAGAGAAGVAAGDWAVDAVAARVVRRVRELDRGGSVSVFDGRRGWAVLAGDVARQQSVADRQRRRTAFTRSKRTMRKGAFPRATRRGSLAFCPSSGSRCRAGDGCMS